ncbi:RNA polymerase sigma factor [Geothrix paludis]|uniref:RNA polymerase sigma factor n=1 Tax=Geothrix paludis TaxID=2922722 RepID=UPI001FAE1C55|nr:sigma-70 family RNA polymerase sigma factor [Geothrix paludis]
MSSTNPDPVLSTLLEAREQFVRFLTAQTQNRAEAEDLVQASLLKVIQTTAQPDSADSAVAWFYRVLRNALADHHRARQSQLRAAERHARELDEAEEPELEQVACQCIKALLPTLKPAEANALEAIDLGGQTLAEAATHLGITPNAMAVRLHRARKALREKVERTCRTCAAHGCLDCRCRPALLEPKNL